MTRVFRHMAGTFGHGKRTATKRPFNDRIRIYTAPSGTQSIRIIDLLLDKEVEEEMNQLDRILKQRQAGI